jgi:imidazole glycerol-phosphate synthase subunit HisH
MIGIIDYGVGNIGSILNMLKKVGHKAEIVNKHSDFTTFRKLILPGVGAFDYGAQKLNESGLWDILNHEVIENKKPILGICLGMQLMTKGSEEGKLKGLGWFEAETVKFNSLSLPKEYKIPHMGWNNILIKKPSSILSAHQQETPRFYFVHSYHVISNEPTEVLFTANYGYDFVSGLEKNNIVGVQFHPEKSHKFGMDLLKHFAENFYSEQ